MYAIRAASIMPEQREADGNGNQAAQPVAILWYWHEQKRQRSTSKAMKFR